VSPASEDLCHSRRSGPPGPSLPSRRPRSGPRGRSVQPSRTPAGTAQDRSRGPARVERSPVQSCPDRRAPCSTTITGSMAICSG
jgi:hypothetical protein